MTFLRIKKFDNGKPILFGLNSMKAPFSVKMNAVDLLANSNGEKLVPEGMFVVGDGSAVRFLPRTKINVATTTSGGTARNVVLRSPNVQFKVGDVLYAQAGYAEVVFSGTFATNDTFVIRIGGVSYTGTVGGTQTAAGAVSAFLTEHGAALTAAGITATAKGNSIVIHATDAHKIDVFSPVSGIQLDVRTTDPGYLGDHVLPLGTIASISAADANGLRTAVLAADAAYVVPAGAAVGVAVSDYLGIYPDPLDFTEEPHIHLAPIYEADGVYEQNLPYVDLQLKRMFSGLNIQQRFFKYV